jgi:hypothetical protein
MAMASKRKLINFDPETRLALDLLSRDRANTCARLPTQPSPTWLIKHRGPAL